MQDKHSYIACVRETTQNLPSIDAIKPFGSEDEACLREINEVLARHGATSRFGVSLLHSHFEMADDEVLLEETDVVNRKQVLSVVKKSKVPAGAIFMDRRFDLAGARQVNVLFGKMAEYCNDLLCRKLEDRLSLSADDAAILFADIKRFLALCSSTPSPLAPPRIVDQGWHEFVLITKDYSEFCDKYCGRFIHHQPADPAAKTKDYLVERRRTRELAEIVFGNLSRNWNESLTGGGCTHNCGTGDVEQLQEVRN